jgi:hypothetical protein
VCRNQSMMESELSSGSHSLPTQCCQKKSTPIRELSQKFLWRAIPLPLYGHLELLIDHVFTVNSISIFRIILRSYSSNLLVHIRDIINGESDMFRIQFCFINRSRWSNTPDHVWTGTITKMKERVNFFQVNYYGGSSHNSIVAGRGSSSKI